MGSLKWLVLPTVFVVKVSSTCQVTICFFYIPRLIFPSLSPLLVSIEVPHGLWGLSTTRELEKVVGGWSCSPPAPGGIQGYD